MSPGSPPLGSDPMDVTTSMSDDLVPVLKPRSEVELVFAVAALDSESIPHFVHNGHFGGLYPGMRIGLFNQRTILVPSESAAAALRILEGLRGRGQLLPWRSPVLGRGRMLGELLLFSWCVPGSSARVRPAHALAVALLGTLMLSVLLALLITVFGLLGTWWEGLNRGRAPHGGRPNAVLEQRASPQFQIG